ncbi:MAG: hypothetical protein ABI782_08540 [Anaerolineaceae bacterium]
MALAFSLAACGDDDAQSTPGPTVASTATTAAVTTAPSATSFATSTRPAPTPAADGTVDALGAGDTDTKTVKAQPGEFSGQALLKDVRMGVHPELGGWDRIVFEFSGPNLPPATIGYVATASQCGSGAPVVLKGAAVLNVRFSQAAAHDQSAQPTFSPKTLPGPGTTILEAKASCDFEGVVSWAAGIKAKQPFKVTTLQNPTRLVIDVKQ